MLAKVEAGLGMEAACREHAARAARLGVATGMRIVEARAEHALGLLELGAGRPDVAVAHLTVTAEFALAHGLGSPVLLEWAGDLVEAHIRAGSPERARRALAVLEREAAAPGTPAGRRDPPALLARCCWATTTRPRPPSSRRCAGTPRPGGRSRRRAPGCAWASTCGAGAGSARPARRWPPRCASSPGSARRRGRSAPRPSCGRRAPARPAAGGRTLDAGDGARRPAAGPAAGRPRRGTAPLQLTPQELQVALVVAGGATNAEAAAQLFLSPKTIEYHLSNAYRKLGIRSRAELVRAVLAAPRPRPERRRRAQAARKYFARSAGAMWAESRSKMLPVRSRARATSPEQTNWPSMKKVSRLPVSIDSAMLTVESRL